MPLIERVKSERGVDMEKKDMKFIVSHVELRGQQN